MAADPDWFVIINDEIRGPFTADQMRTAAQQGLVFPQTKVRKGAVGDWFRADQIKGLLPPVAPQAPPSLEPEPAAPLPASPPRPARPAPVQADSPVDEIPLVKTRDRGSSPVNRAKKRKRSRSNPWPVLVAAVAGFALLMGMLYWLSLPGKAKAPSKDKATKQTSPR